MCTGCNSCKGSDVKVFACAGGSNVGQLTNSAAVEVTKEGKGKMYCLAGWRSCSEYNRQYKKCR